MTSVYGVTSFGATQQIMNRLEELPELEHLSDHEQVNARMHVHACMHVHQKIFHVNPQPAPSTTAPTTSSLHRRM